MKKGRLTDIRLSKWIDKHTGLSSDLRAWRKDSVVLEISSLDLQFEKLVRLSELLGTKKINIGAETQQDQYYPVTYPGSKVIVSISEITRWPDEYQWP